MTREEHHTQDRVGLARDWRRSDVPGAVDEPEPEHTTARAHPCPFCEDYVTRYPSRLARHTHGKAVLVTHVDDGEPCPGLSGRRPARAGGDGAAGRCSVTT